MLLLFWNVKYFGPTSDNFADRVHNVAEHIRRCEPDIVVLVELTNRADETLGAIQGKLQDAKLTYRCKAINVDGGNNEHFAVMLRSEFGIGAAAGLGTRDDRIGAGTRKIGHISIGKLGDTNAFGLYICHPSPCALTNATALKNATELFDVVGRGRALMVGDFNAKDWTAAGASAVHPGPATHQSAHGTLRTIDGAIFREMGVTIEKSQRITSSAAQSDHSWILFKLD
jgi:endonuclease/exonuclease/phosphatase family metal-dependent hydrolase